MYCIILFMIVGGGSFVAGYLTRVILFDGYSYGWCDGCKFGRNIRESLDKDEEDK